MINSSAFPNTQDASYWSSTTYNNEHAVLNPDADEWAWTIDFTYGNVLLHMKDLVDGNNDSYVRCVTGP
jgi:hypothetical protein